MPMKYSLLLIVIFFAACKQPPAKKASETKKTKSTQVKTSGYRQAVLREYQTFLGGLDTTKMGSPTLAAKKYVALFANRDQPTRDTAYFLIYQTFFYHLIDAIDESRGKQTLSFDSLIVNTTDGDTLPQPKLSAALVAYGRELKENGFYIYMSEGDTYIGWDYDFDIKWFSPYLSTTLQQYLVQFNKEEKEGFQEDAGLTISPVQLASRTVWWENFAAKHPGTIIARSAKANWQAYLATLLQGMDNTPVMQDENGDISAYYKEALTYLQSTSPSSQTCKLTSAYFGLLLKKEKARADALLKDYKNKKLI